MRTLATRNNLSPPLRAWGRGRVPWMTSFAVLSVSLIAAHNRLTIHRMQVSTFAHQDKRLANLFTALNGSIVCCMSSCTSALMSPAICGVHLTLIRLLV